MRRVPFVDIHGTDLLRFNRDGQIVEHWHIEQTQQLFQQLEADPG